MHTTICSVALLLVFYSTNCYSEDRTHKRQPPGDYVRLPEDFFSPPPVGGPPEPAYGYFIITNPFYYREIYAPAFHPYAGIPLDSFPQDPNSVYDVSYNDAFKGSVSPNYFNENSEIPGNFRGSLPSHNPAFSTPNNYAPSFPTDSQHPYNEYPQSNIPPYPNPNYLPTSTQNPPFYSPQSPPTRPVTIPTIFTSTTPNVIIEENTRGLDKANTPSEPPFLSSSYAKSFSPSSVPLFVAYDSQNIIREETPIIVKPTSIYPVPYSPSSPDYSSSHNPFNFDPIFSTTSPLNPPNFHPVPSSPTVFPALGPQSYVPPSSTPGPQFHVPLSPTPGYPDTPTSIFTASTETSIYNDLPTAETPPQANIFYEAPGHESPQ